MRVIATAFGFSDAVDPQTGRRPAAAERLEHIDQESKSLTLAKACDLVKNHKWPAGYSNIQVVIQAIEPKATISHE